MLLACVLAACARPLPPSLRAWPLSHRPPAPYKLSQTTDLVSKEAALQLNLGGKTVHLGGMCKGSGMIHPNMATMLGVVTCDAEVEPEVWRGMLRRATDASFNAVGWLAGG